MEPLDKSRSPQNESKLYYVGLGALLAIGVFFAVRDYQLRSNDITLHVPKVEAR